MNGKKFTFNTSEKVDIQAIYNVLTKKTEKTSNLFKNGEGNEQIILRG